MNVPSHMAYPYLLANMVAWLMGVRLSVEQNILLVIFSVLPDVDLGIHWLYTRITKVRFNIGINHHQWASHWPISYIPLALVFAIWPNTTTLLMIFGILSHLLMDSIACSWGIMWLYPFSKRWFNYYASRFMKINDGKQWLAEWNKTNFHVVEMIGLGLMIIHFILY